MIEKKPTIIGVVAPALSAALGGPLAALALRRLGVALGAKDPVTRERIEAAMASATGDQLRALKAEDEAFAKEMLGLGIEIGALAWPVPPPVPPRESFGFPAILAVFTILGFFVYLAVATFYPLPEGSREFVNLAVGLIGGYAGAVISFYFGSSQSQERNLDLIRQNGSGNQ